MTPGVTRPSAVVVQSHLIPHVCKPNVLVEIQGGSDDEPKCLHLTKCHDMSGKINKGARAQTLHPDIFRCGSGLPNEGVGRQKVRHVP